VYWADVEVNPGNSGGPSYRVEDGSVIGVCVASPLVPIYKQSGGPAQEIGGERLMYSSGLTLIIPAKYAFDLVRLHVHQSE
jgi:S1-C subfamily serine protease